MPASFVHARRLSGRWVHVRDLDPSAERGLACNCVCSECGKPLVAHFGEVKAAHFQHQVEDVNCNPQPMTLMHAFARDYIASQSALWLPGMETALTHEAWGRTWRENFSFEDQDFQITAAFTEQAVGEFVPDVLLEGSQGKIAVEVKYTHAVDKEKQAKIARHRLNCIEFDISDLPPDCVSTFELRRALAQRKRWQWIWAEQHAQANDRFCHRIGWEGSEWRADRRRIGQAELYLPMAADKLRTAEKRLSWAQSVYSDFRMQSPAKPAREEAAVWLSQFETEDRFAIFCAAAGLVPTSLPVNFMQKVAQGFWKHPYAWQLGIFVFFGFQRDWFTSTEVATWLKIAMPECSRVAPDWKTKNGFTENAAAAHSYLLQLEHQGLLVTDGHRDLERRVFRGRFKDRADFHRHLPRIRAASGVIDPQ